MKLGLYTDPHISQSSSIIVGRRGEFTGRLDNLIKSFTWMNDFFKTQEISGVVCLGDLTDKPHLTAEEITAMSKCGIDDHTIIVGNHCRSDKDGSINSLAIYPHVISTPQIDTLGEVAYIPYIHNPGSLREILDSLIPGVHPKVILSHNDLKGYDFGAGHICSEGFDVEEILECCDLYINGHLHNGGWVVEGRIMNLGALSGVNFASCGGQWEPSVAVVDTDTCEVQLFENPEAYRFKKVEFSTLPKLKGFLDNLNGQHYVVQVKVPDTIAQKARKLLDQNDKVEASRIITYSKNSSKKKTTKIKTSTDSSTVYDKLRNYVNEKQPSYSIDTINKIIDKISKSEEGAE